MKRFFLVVSLSLTLLRVIGFSYDEMPLYRDNTASYILQVTRTLTQQLLQTKNIAALQAQTLTITPTVNIDDLTTTLPITRQIDENMLYQLNHAGFHVIDVNALKILGAKDITSDLVLVSTYTRYRYEMVINARIIERKTGITSASAQVRVPRRVLKNVEKLYNKNSWFTPQK